MATYTVINQNDSPALREQSALVSLNQSQAAIYLGGMGAVTLGERCMVVSSNMYGFVDTVDLYGTSFKIKPQYPWGNMASIYGGHLAANDLITLF
jgi:hypothetical protein